jgi:hypothetical protein
LTGVGLYAYAKVHPALIAGMTDNDHIFPRFILTTMPPGLRGLVNLLWLAFRMVAFTYGRLLGTMVVATMSNWKVDGLRVLGLMLASTGLTLTLGITADG